ncbi:MAG: tRNA uridine-5-carboxymethylaminomethyl(34) synthesis GTPase MnmE [Intestinimonas sp.]|jgi:tRNA modification GTPase|nr:tRNA uridine-5-carboxymethylaminomethyl(34) synthesis GTPase MnmE [Intestinimonas sp.]
MSDLIAAIATPPIPCAIGILRLSGPGAAAAVDQVFRAFSGRTMTQAPDRALVYGTLLDREGAPIDRVLATISRAPHSYTGEDTAELQCHGAPAVLALGLEALYAAGARPAKPGEFTRRAFLNGKLDLTQAEAVGDLLEAQTDAAVHTAAGQLAGGISRRAEEIYRELVDLSAHFHAVLDYPDEDIDPFRAETLSKALERGENGLSALLDTYERGRFVARGVPCVLAGRTNAGKSSLLNALLGYQRAIVTDIPGTTRDTVEETVRLDGVLLRLIDTAGLREGGDAVERLGMERSRAALDRAALALLVLDGSVPLTPEDKIAMAEAQRAERVLCVVNKADRGTVVDLPALRARYPALCLVSARTGAGLSDLSASVAALFPQPGAGGGLAMLTNARQAQAVTRALDALREAHRGFLAGITPDAALTDVEEAMGALGELTGRTVREDVVDRIFSRFCVGK